MKKIVSKKTLVIVLIIAILTPIVSYALSSSDNKVFFSSDKTEVSPGELITMDIDLSFIEYEDFEFSLTSNISLDEVSTNEIDENIDVSSDENEFKIISNKSDINLDKISLYYKIPEEIEIGTKINLTGIIKKYESEVDESEELEEESNEQEVTLTITVIQKVDDEITSDDTNKDNNVLEKPSTENTVSESNNQNAIKNQTSESQPQNSQMQFGSNFSEMSVQTQISSTSKTQSATTSSISSLTGNFTTQEETNTYNGESNNYLSSLSIDGYTLSPEFLKTNNTYFISVEKDITEVSVIAVAEDENAVVKIYGNSNLQDGENKVLISVTAENGEVKTYRVYITK